MSAPLTVEAERADQGLPWRIADLSALQAIVAVLGDEADDEGDT